MSDILIKRLPIIFGDYLNTKDIEKFSFEQHNMNTEMEEIEEYPPELMSDSRSLPQAEILAQRLKDQNHGAHRVDVIVDKDGSGQPLILYDGFTFRSKSGRKSRLTFLNNYYKCTYRSCRAFIKIREGRLLSGPTSKSMHSNHHKKWKAFKRIQRLETIRQFNIKLKQRFLDKMPGWSWWSSRDASQVNCCGWNWNWNKNNCKYFVKLQHCNTTLGTLPSLGGDIKYFNSIIYCTVYTLNTNYTIRMHLLFLRKYIFAC